MCSNSINKSSIRSRPISSKGSSSLSSKAFNLYNAYKNQVRANNGSQKKIDRTVVKSRESGLTLSKAYTPYSVHNSYNKVCNVSE